MKQRRSRLHTVEASAAVIALTMGVFYPASAAAATSYSTVQWDGLFAGRIYIKRLTSTLFGQPHILFA